jgi:esterase
MPVKLNYNIFGEGHPVIILHGLLGSSRNWTAIAKRLSSFYQIIAVDLRNHGDSEHHESMTYEDMADDVERINQGIDHS